MDSSNNNLDAIINKVFNKDIQQKRAKKEILSLKELDTVCYKISLQTTAIGLRVLVEVSESVIAVEIPDSKRIGFPIIFELMMDQNFPFNPPKVFAKTSFHEPSLADGRDYLHDIIQRNWNPAILLKDIINILPEFLKRIEELPKPEESQLLGEFHLGTSSTIEDYISLPNSSIFPGEEVIQDKSSAVERLFVVVESFFLSFETTDRTKNTMKLMSWAHIQSIANIKKSKEDPRRLVVTWFDKSRQSGVVQNVYLVDESKRFVELLVQAGQKYGVKVSKGQKRDLALSDVTIKNYEDIKIEELLDNITCLESKLENEITISVINLLMNLYQKAIEYFSAFNDPVYNDFIQRLQYLLQRPDVQAVLQSREDEDLKQKERERKHSEEKLKENEEEKKEDFSDDFQTKGNPIHDIYTEANSIKDQSPKKLSLNNNFEETIVKKVDNNEVKQETIKPSQETEKVDQNVFAIDNEEEEEKEKEIVQETSEPEETQQDQKPKESQENEKGKKGKPINSTEETESKAE